MKQIETLVPDILSLFGNDRTGAIDPDRMAGFIGALSKKVQHRLTEEYVGGTLRMSNAGKPCERQLWYSVNASDKAEPLEPAARIKFLYGDILEEMLLYLAREAGHTVEQEQEEVVLHGVVGHIDAVIDGVLVDCKSASPFSYQKFAAGLSPATDEFGYLTQLDLYLHAMGLDRGGFLAIHKVTGQIHLDLHARSTQDVSSLIEHKRSVLANSVPPARAFAAVADGKSGNKKLGVACSYCPFKQTCWPNLRTFYYSTGPRYLTEVRRTPAVDEEEV